MCFANKVLWRNAKRPMTRGQFGLLIDGWVEIRFFDEKLTSERNFCVQGTERQVSDRSGLLRNQVNSRASEDCEENNNKQVQPKEKKIVQNREMTKKSNQKWKEAAKFIKPGPST